MKNFVSGSSVVIGFHTGEQWNKRALEFTGAKKMLEKIDGGHSKNIFNFITGVEIWMYQYDPETKSSFQCGSSREKILQQK